MPWFPKKTTGPVGEGQIIAIVGPKLWDKNPAYSKNIQLVSTRKEDAYSEFSLQAAAAVSAAVGPYGTAPRAKVVYTTANIEGIIPAGGSALSFRDFSKRETPLRELYQGLRFLENYMEQGNRLDVVSTSAGWRDGDPFSRRLNDVAFRLENGDRKLPVYSMNRFSLGEKGNPFFCCDQSGPVPLKTDEQSLTDKYSLFDWKNLKDRVGIPVEGIQIACGDPSHAAYQRSSLYKSGGGGDSAHLAPHVVAGLFGLAKEQCGHLTKKGFEKLVLDTAQKTTIDTENGPLSFRIPNPLELIKAARKKGGARSRNEAFRVVRPSNKGGAVYAL